MNQTLNLGTATLVGGRVIEFRSGDRMAQVSLSEPTGVAGLNVWSTTEPVETRFYQSVDEAVSAAAEWLTR